MRPQRGLLGFRHVGGCAFNGFLLWGCLLLPLGFGSRSYAESSAIVEAPPSSPIIEAPNLPTTPLKFTLSPDGTIHAINESGKLCWSFSSGGPLHPSLSSLMLVEPIGEWSGDDPLLQEDLQEQLKPLIAQTPIVTDEGVVMGASLKTVFVVDPATGKLIHKFEVNGTTSSNDPLLASMITDLKPIFFQRTDHSLQCFEVSTGSVKWSVRFAEIGSLNEDNGFPEHVLKGNESTAIVLNPGDKPSKNSFHGTRYTPISVYPDNLFGFMKNTTIFPVGIPLYPPRSNDVPALPSAAADSHTGSFLGNGWHIGGGWLIGGLLACLVWVVMGLKGILHMRQNRQQVVKEKRKKRKGQKSGGSADRIVQENISKQDDDRKPTQLKTTRANGLLENSNSGTKVGNLDVTKVLIGLGSHGTSVLEGYLDKRPVAVKRMLAEFYERAAKEIAALIALDAHPNVVRYFAMEQDNTFVYIALEKCSFNLGTFIQAHSTVDNKRGNEYDVKMEAELQAFLQEEKLALWDKFGLPSPLLMKLMRDVVEGLVHLHKLGYVHRDLKPQNVLIRINGKNLTAKISDMGISKRLKDGASSIENVTSGVIGSIGWQAPEQIQGKRQTRAVDLFSVGCLLYFCISGGQHPFGADFERNVNIIRGNLDLFAIDHIPEATHLLSSLLDTDPRKRLSALQVKFHPFFWSSQKRLSFLIAASDRVEREDREEGSAVLTALEAVAPVALGGAWNEKLDTPLISNLGRYRQYNYQTVRDLLRVIRNKANHYRELPPDVQELLGSVPHGYESYFRTRFPKLLMEVFKVLYQHCSEEDMFAPYFAQEQLYYAE